MSDFSHVDAGADPDRLVRYLDATDAGLVAIKRYIAAAAARALPPGALVVDVGCGVGHDVERLTDAGLGAIGLDASAVMLARARDRARAGTPPSLVRGDGLRLPFRTGSVDGCRVERVLQHVADPEPVVAEIRRILRADGWFAVFEPDHTSCRVASEAGDDFLAKLLRVRHPAVGAQLASMAERHGFVVDDVVTETSFGRRLDRLPVDADAVVQRAVADGRADGAEVDCWLREQRTRTDEGTFRSTWVKVLVVARATVDQRGLAEAGAEAVVGA